MSLWHPWYCLHGFGALPLGNYRGWQGLEEPSLCSLPSIDACMDFSMFRNAFGFVYKGPRERFQDAEYRS